MVSKLSAEGMLAAGVDGTRQRRGKRMVNAFIFDVNVGDV